MNIDTVISTIPKMSRYYNMSKAKLRKTLASMEKEEIIETILELYSVRKEAKDYFEYWLNPDSDKLLEKSKGDIKKLFFTSKDISRRKPATSALNKIVKDFMTVCFGTDKNADLLLYLAEQQTEWISRRRAAFSYLPSLNNNVKNVELYIVSNDLEPIFGLRLENLKTKTEEIKENMLPPRRRHTSFFLFSKQK